MGFRADMLGKNASFAVANKLKLEVHKLTHADEMGRRFKVMAITVSGALSGALSGRAPSAAYSSVVSLCQQDAAQEGPPPAIENHQAAWS